MILYIYPTAVLTFSSRNCYMSVIFSPLLVMVIKFGFKFILLIMMHIIQVMNYVCIPNCLEFTSFDYAIFKTY